MNQHQVDLPYVDTHAVRIEAPRERVWSALETYAARSLLAPKPGPLVGLLGTQPPAGFEVAERVPSERLALVGRHRFSRYRLVFEVADAPGGATQLRAQTYAVFPGPHGRVYQALVIGTRLHVVATTRMLRSVGRVSREPVRR